MANVSEFEMALMHRDEISKREAKRKKQEAREALYDILENGGGYDEVEDMIAGDYGLEMDYIMDLI